MTTHLTVSAVQFEVRELTSFDDFADDALAAVKEAAGSQIVVLPELTTLGLASIAEGWREEDPAVSFARLPEYTDDYVALFTAMARDNGQVIAAGSHLVDDSPRGLLNVAHVFFPDGQVLRRVKTHIFPGESAWRTGEGDVLDTFEVDGVTVAVMVCYEAEVPEVATILARQSADVLLVPSYTFTESGFNRVRTCLAARCIENQVYAVHCSTFGTGEATLAPGWARSSALGPCDAGLPADGVLAEAPANEPAVLTHRFDLELLRELRENGHAPTVRDRARRADVYRRYGDLLWPR
jgi:predicted amidohydrolase